MASKAVFKNCDTIKFGRAEIKDINVVKAVHVDESGGLLVIVDRRNSSYETYNKIIYCDAITTPLTWNEYIAIVDPNNKIFGLSSDLDKKVEVFDAQLIANNSEISASSSIDLTQGYYIGSIEE